MLLQTILLALGTASFGATAAIPKPGEDVVWAPETKREVENSVYLLTKRMDEDSLYKKDSLYDANEDGLYKKDGLYKPAEDGLYKKDSLYDAN